MALSNEDRLIIFSALDLAAKEVRRIEREKQQKQQKQGEQTPLSDSPMMQNTPPPLHQDKDIA